MKLWVQPPVAFACGAHHRDEPGRWEAALDFLFGYRPSVLTLSLGWGWGPRDPLRPWPRGWWGTVSWKQSQEHKGDPVGLSYGGSFCGFYINFIRISHPAW